MGLCNFYLIMKGGIKLANKNKLTLPKTEPKKDLKNAKLNIKKTKTPSTKKIPNGMIVVSARKFSGTITCDKATHTFYEMIEFSPNRLNTVTVSVPKKVSKKVKDYTIYRDSSGYTYIPASELYGTKTLSATNGRGINPNKYYIRESTAMRFIASDHSQQSKYSTTPPEKFTTVPEPEYTDAELDEMRDNVNAVADGTTSSKLDDAVDVDVNASDLMSSSMNGIFGLPYQWMETCDNRLKKSEFGRMYANKIAARMPLLFLTPGNPSFMPGSDKDTRKNVSSLITESLGGFTDKIEKAVDTFLGGAKDEGCNKFYSFKFDYETYYSYVNPMCQTTARLLQLTKNYGKVKVNGKPRNLEKFCWQNSLSGKFSNYFSAVNAIPFYIDSISTVNESFSNDTTQSFLANTAKSVSQQAKELNFLLGTATGMMNDNNLIKNAVNDIKSKIADASTNATASNFLTKVSTSLMSLANGGGMLFPDIWDSSSFGRSYSINMKLRSPDCDDLSIYLNVLVPLYHLLAMVAPHTLGQNYNAYSAPFLVRAYCKGAFNIDMGIITSMDVSKGKEGSWNANGLPTEMDISLSIKDLYELFSITPMDSAGINIIKDVKNARKIVKNTAMMDYLANTVGLNINKSELTRDVQTLLNLTASGVVNWPNKQWLKLQNAVDNKIHSVFSLRSK